MLLKENLRQPKAKIFFTIPLQNFPFRGFVENISAFDYLKYASERRSWCLWAM